MDAINEEQLENGYTLKQEQVMDDIIVWRVYDREGVCRANAARKEDAAMLADFHAKESAR